MYMCASLSLYLRLHLLLLSHTLRLSSPSLFSVPALPSVHLLLSFFLSVSRTLSRSIHLSIYIYLSLSLFLSPTNIATLCNETRPPYPFHPPMNSPCRSLIHTHTHTHTHTCTDTASINKWQDCADVKKDDPSAKSGTYDVAVDGTPFKVYCDMTTQGGSEPHCTPPPPPAQSIYLSIYISLSHSHELARSLANMQHVGSSFQSHISTHTRVRGGTFSLSLSLSHTHTVSLDLSLRFLHCLSA